MPSSVEPGNFYTAMSILLDNFAVYSAILNSNVNLTMKNGKTGKNEDVNFFAMIFKISKLSANMNSDQNSETFNT